jgi:hypothetical protein
MVSLSCNCGHTEKDADRYKVEARMWVHAIRDHIDMLKGMGEAQLEQWLRDKDQKLGVAAK